MKDPADKKKWIVDEEAAAIVQKVIDGLGPTQIAKWLKEHEILCPSAYCIRNVVLQEIVLRNLREAIQYVTEHETEFIQEAADSRMRDRDAEFARKREALSKADQNLAGYSTLRWTTRQLSLLFPARACLLCLYSYRRGHNHFCGAFSFAVCLYLLRLVSLLPAAF